jgi:hypothetical protein
MSQGKVTPTFAEYFRTRQSAACVFCGRRPEEGKNGEFFPTCRPCHRQELDALAQFAQGHLTFGQLKAVPVTAATLLSRGMVESLARNFESWSGHVDPQRLQEWMDSPSIHRTWKGSVYDQFLRKMELAVKVIDTAQKAAAPEPAALPDINALGPAPAAPAVADSKSADAPAPEPAAPEAATVEGTVVVPDINALSEGELEALTAPEPVAEPVPAAPAAEPVEVKKARAKRAKK